MNIEHARTNMITQQLRTSAVLDQQVLDVIAHTQREQFVPQTYHNLAFADMYIPLSHGQVMLTPREEARLIQALKITTEDKVLEVGTGSGYMTALLAQLSHWVTSIDLFPDFTRDAHLKLMAHNIANVTLVTANAAQGWDDGGIYNVIAITGSLPFLPKSFQQILKPGGRLFAILGEAPTMTATLFTHNLDGEWVEEKIFETVVPPLLQAIEPSRFIF